MANYKRYIRKAGRMAYKATGYKNPMKKGKLSSARVVRQIPRLMRDVGMLQKMVNAEKKRIEVKSPTDFSFAIGQSNVNNSGHYLADLTPQPTQGTGYAQKTGNSIKWVSSHLDFQFVSQANNISGMRLKIQLVKVVGLPYSSVNDVMGKFIEPTAFLTGGTIYDINSPRDPDYFRNFKVLRTAYVKIKNDEISGEQTYKRLSVGLKLKNHHVRTNDDDPTLSMGQVFILITADQGNAGNTISTINGGPQNGLLTGCFMRYEWTHYYYDN